MANKVIFINLPPPSTPAACTSAPPVGQVYASANGGDAWAAIVTHLPTVLSVEVQTVP